MVLSSGHRLMLRRVLRTKWLRVALVIFAVVNFFDVMRIHNRIKQDELQSREPTHRKGERIYIASMHFNDAELVKEHWSDALLQLIDVIGAENTFVSIFESGSWDDTKTHLAALDHELEARGVPRRVELGEISHETAMKEGPQDGEGWIQTPRNKKELRRIPFLSKLRNKTLQDLREQEKKGVHFDKVLFLNDVVFTPDDVINLMQTNGGDYAAACSLDFANPPQYYDTFALRDSKGHAHLMPTWPYFRSGDSRNALIGNSDSVPVKSCWNGIVVMPAEPFISSSELEFRGVPDSLALHHLEGSECCLIHADNPLSKTLGVYLNAQVRVAYNYPAYVATHPPGKSWVSPMRIFWGLWVNRVARWTKFSLDEWTVKRRVAKWTKEDMHNSEPGVFCLINEMQVIVENGWAHI